MRNFRIIRCLVVVLFGAMYGGATLSAPLLTIGPGTAVTTPVATLTFDNITNSTVLASYTEAGATLSAPAIAFVTFDPTAGAGGFSGGFYFAADGVNAPYDLMYGGATMDGIEFVIGSGNLAAHTTDLIFQTFSHGSPTGSGSGSTLSLGSIVGISDPSGFDEIRLSNTGGIGGSGGTNVLALDNLGIQIESSGSVSEPTTLALLTVALIGVGFNRWRRFPLVCRSPPVRLPVRVVQQPPPPRRDSFS
jgi:hypothetical protein